MIIKRHLIDAKAEQHPDGYIEDVLSFDLDCGKNTNTIRLSKDAHVYLRSKWQNLGPNDTPPAEIATGKMPPSYIVKNLKNGAMGLLKHLVHVEYCDDDLYQKR
ncbi:MAG: hypothetical protein MI744_14640, partial [Pseudomonadales bacterium]|nr:hypothetical protein [Pseudomonadales bacterium]